VGCLLKTIQIEVEGVSPILFHRMTEDEMLSLPPFGSKTKKKAPPKESKSPRELAQCRLYVANGDYVIPSIMFISAFKNAASEYKQSSSSRKSMKGIATAIFRPKEEFVKILDENGKPHKSWEVDIAVAKNHLKGAVVNVRPRFDRWKASFEVLVDTDLISEDTAQAILSDAGNKVGIGSWRIMCSGKYGQFRITKWQN
jgi:hypothetical protein